MDAWVTALLFFASIGFGAMALGSSIRSRPPVGMDWRLARIERQLGLIMQRLEIEEPEPSVPGVMAELEQGNKIKAIKIYREQTGAGLVEAKSAVDVIARERGL